MENTKKTFAQIVREKYGDTRAQFARRIGAQSRTVKSWEQGQPLQSHARALLNVAWNNDVSLEIEVSPEFSQLTLKDKVLTLCKNFGDKKRSFAQRIGVNELVIHGWTVKGKESTIGHRLLDLVASHPEWFVTVPKKF